ncbi:hypothetical protein K437DRAFT_247176 [Tilletiaria anomala UBC 951]|uniref:MFS general substrate transporter n=1 Tax=Tilletiaria anomala (strain ATCC 24038 / CBS 436.72 / UBC 951) TaxID=1037660 RepID=A0A066VUT6_TILAU|nr:uncharacterized protein K437DRAFT_247176 [Tilletiaria anomala UBC 951]KDN45482.1 hypothetical protein K437DRAFT_247176 [Tilletiaria anomala UBC 951]
MSSDSASDKAVHADEKGVHPAAAGKVNDASDVIVLSHATFASAAPRRRGPLGIYDHTACQVALLGLVCFLGPGMFNALSGIGGGGQVDRTPSINSSIALYSVFAVMAFFSGSIHNTIGSKPTLFIGTLGYSLYIGSLLSYNFNQNGGFVIGAGAVLGACAGLLWCSQGALMLSYPAEREKGRYISIFWVIFNLGAVLGAAIAMGLSWHSTSNTVSNGTYIAFLVLTALGAFVSLTLKSPGKVRRTDGVPVVVPKQMGWTDEFRGLIRVLHTDPWIVLLFPLFLASNWFYTWQFNIYNGLLFTLRTRALNSFIYWLSQMVGSFCIGLLLDSPRLARRTRAWIGWGVAICIVFAVWGGSYHVQLGYTRADKPSEGLGSEYYRTDVHSPEYGGLAVLYACMGLLDSITQCFTYWLFGAMSNDLAKLAHFAGFYKSVQSAGSVGAFALDKDGASFMAELGVGWGLNAAGLIIALPVLAFRVTETTDALQEKTVEGREQDIKQIVDKVVHENN